MQQVNHLEPLLDGTPLALDLLKSAWSSLPFRDRAYLLTVLLSDSSNKKPRWTHHYHQILDLGLSDQSAYIRYLAAKKVKKPIYNKDDGETPLYLNEKSLYDRKKADSISMVQMAQEPSPFRFFIPELDDPEAFWNLPQKKRLTLVTHAEFKGKEFAECLRFAINNLLPIDTLSIIEILDVLLQFLGKDAISKSLEKTEKYAHTFGDGQALYDENKKLQYLWNLIPDVPELIVYALVDALPECDDMPIKKLNEGQICHLLKRKDIKLESLRRILFKESTNDLIREAAVQSVHFKLSYPDIFDLVYAPQNTKELAKKKTNDLVMLSACGGATLVQRQVICDLLINMPNNFIDAGQRHYITFGELDQSRRAKFLDIHTLREEIFDLRLYELTKTISPYKGDLKPRNIPQNLKHYEPKLIPNNPWQNYLNLREFVHLGNWKRHIDYLPEADIRYFDLPNELVKEFDRNYDRQKIFDLLDNVQVHIKDIPEQNRIELSALSGAFSELSNQIIEAENMTLKRIDVLHKSTEKLVLIVNVLLWGTGAILFISIFG
jgi:hypothetical protein